MSADCAGADSVVMIGVGTVTEPGSAVCNTMFDDDDCTSDVDPTKADVWDTTFEIEMSDDKGSDVVEVGAFEISEGCDSVFEIEDVNTAGTVEVEIGTYVVAESELIDWRVDSNNVVDGAFEVWDTVLTIEG